MKRLTNEDFIIKCKEIHGDKFDYFKTNYINTRTKIIIICKIHGEFEITPDNHINQKQGCVKCARDNHKLTKLSNERLESFKKIHNNKYSYLDLSVNNGIINIICPEHGKFEQIIYNHEKGHGCPDCNSSKGEEKIKSILESKNIKFKRNHEFEDCKRKRKLRFDFHLPELNTCIEYDGEHHYIENQYFGEGNLEYMKLNDDIKNKYCYNNGIKLIRIPYWEFENIDDLINI
jgi:hypothetical protein